MKSENTGEGKMIRNIVVITKKIIQKIEFWFKLKCMDDMWYYTGGSCFGLFPPSFYYTHTEEEIERIIDETLDNMQKMIDQLD